MSDFLVDIIVIRKDGSSVYYEEVPEPWLARFTKGCAGAVMIKFIFSDKQAWTWDLQFNFSQVQRKEGLFIHPVLTPLQPQANGGGAMTPLRPIHISEDVQGWWVFDDYVKDIKAGINDCRRRVLIY